MNHETAFTLCKYVRKPSGILFWVVLSYIIQQTGFRILSIMETSGFEQVVQAFSRELAELREATLLRVDNTTKVLYKEDLANIEATVQALEIQFDRVKTFLSRERDSIPKIEALLEACRQQQACIQKISDKLPASAPAAVGNAGILQQQNSNDYSNKLPQKKTAPRRYISTEEFNGAPSYMRGRLTACKVNSAIDELAAKAETNMGLVAGARRNKPLGSDRNHAYWLMVHFGNNELLKGKFFFIESDMKLGQAVRMDNTGRSLLVLLRHLGRTTEVRVGVEGTTHLAYILLP